MKNIISENLDKHLSLLNITRTELSKRSGISVETIKNLIDERTGNPKIETLCALCKTLNISLDYLTGMKTYDKDKLLLLSNYDACPPSDKILIQEFAKRGKEHALFANEQEHKYIVSCIVPTGAFSRNGMLWDSAIVIDEETFYDNVNFAVKLPTSSYVPVYDNNEILYIEHRYPINEDEAVILYKNDRFFIRRIKYNHDTKNYVLKALTSGQNDIVEKSLKEYNIMGTILTPERCTRNTKKDGKITIPLPLDIKEIIDKYKKEP